MDVYRLAVRVMSMDDATWRRHANPWSAYTRFTVLPLLIVAVWSRVWIGWWAALPVAFVLFWTWLNPRAFPAPKSLDSWISRGVMGERVFLTRRDDVARHHRRAAALLSGASGAGAVVLIWGLVALDMEITALGAALTVIPKVWFVDRMVWVLQDWCAARGGQGVGEDLGGEALGDGARA